MTGPSGVAVVTQADIAVAEHIISAANIISHDGYYELDVDAVAGEVARQHTEVVKPLVEALKRLARDVRDLMGNSQGVHGLHQNGDLATWEELSQGGNLSEWIGDALDQADAALRSAQQ